MQSHEKSREEGESGYFYMEVDTSHRKATVIYGSVRTCTS